MSMTNSSLDHYYIAPKFLDKLAVHITKNFLDLPGVKVPLILGIHGRKGEGKTFQCELVFQRMGIEVLHISAGELESPDAGDPARLIRLRYREAAELIKVRGKMCALMINDIDAGAGRFDQGTQYTVNTQLVNATLMNIADNPTNVQLPGSYDSTPLHRVPILVTGNDFSTLYAPLIRDGRMEKFYWEPTLEDKRGIVGGIFRFDGLSTQDIDVLVQTFSNQAIDFFGAVRSRIYDAQIRDFISKVGLENLSTAVVNPAGGKPVFPQPDFSIDRLLEFGHLMLAEQELINKNKLVEEYNRIRYAQSETTKIISNVISNESQPISAVNELDLKIRDEVDKMIKASFDIAIEYVDRRRFQTNSWQAYGVIKKAQLAEGLDILKSCLAEYPNYYIRLVAHLPEQQKRVQEIIIQRP